MLGNISEGAMSLTPFHPKRPHQSKVAQKSLLVKEVTIVSRQFRQTNEKIFSLLSFGLIFLIFSFIEIKLQFEYYIRLN